MVRQSLETTLSLMDYLDPGHEPMEPVRAPLPSPAEKAGHPTETIIVSTGVPLESVQQLSRRYLYTQIALIVAVVAGLFVAGAYVSERKLVQRWSSVAVENQINSAQSRTEAEDARSQMIATEERLAELQDAAKLIRELEGRIRGLQEAAALQRNATSDAVVALSICLDYQRELLATSGAAVGPELRAKLAAACTEAERLVGSLRQ